MADEKDFPQIFRDLQALQEYVDQLEKFKRESMKQEKEGRLPQAEVLERLQQTIEELHVAEEELRQQNEELIESRQIIEDERRRYLELFEFTPEPYLVTDKVGNILEANAAACEFLNIDLKGLLGMSLMAFLSTETSLDIYSRLSEIEKLKRLEDWETTLKPIGGAQRIVSVTVAAVQSASVENYHWVLRDITKRKQAEEELESYKDHLEELVQWRTEELDEANQNLRKEVEKRKKLEGEATAARIYAENIIQTIREPLLILDSKLRVTSANKAFYQVFHVSKEDTEGHLLYELGNKQWDISRLRDLLEKILPERFVMTDFEVEQDFPSVGSRIMLLNARRMRERAAESGFILLAMEDVTERRMAERKLQKAVLELTRSNEELENFAYVASHDLQEPLRMIASYMQLLARRYIGKLGPDADEFISFAVEGADRMKELIQSLLAYSRVQTRSDAIKNTSSEEILKSVLTNLEIMIQEQGANVTHDPLPIVKADPRQLATVFQNLIQNSIKFRSTAPPQVHISAAEEGQEFIFSVRDNGIGIDPRHQRRIFQLFQRLHPRGLYPGTGIGLTVSRKIIERHGGRIWVESEAGKGATFKFSLPK